MDSPLDDDGEGCKSNSVAHCFQFNMMIGLEECRRCGTLDDSSNPQHPLVVYIRDLEAALHECMERRRQQVSIIRWQRGRLIASGAFRRGPEEKQ